MSVAVLCNAATANPTASAHAVAAEYLQGAFTTPEPAAAGGRDRGSAAPVTVADADLRSYLGRYASDEAETTLVVALEDGALVFKRRPDAVLRARAVAKDTFNVPTLGTVTFHRSSDGHVAEFSVKLDRVWDLRFRRDN